jgi:hypothetical protein
LLGEIELQVSVLLFVAGDEHVAPARMR